MSDGMLRLKQQQAPTLIFPDLFGAHRLTSTHLKLALEPQRQHHSEEWEGEGESSKWALTSSSQAFWNSKSTPVGPLPLDDGDYDSDEENGGFVNASEAILRSRRWQV